MLSELFHSEVLCYIQNYLLDFPKTSVQQTLVGFFKEEEISLAKCQLYEYVESLPADDKPVDLPRHKRRQPSDIRKNVECDDLLKLFKALMDARVKMPKFAAMDLSRVPTIKPGEVDVYTLAVSLENLRQQVVGISSRVTVIESTSSGQPMVHVTETATEIAHVYGDAKQAVVPIEAVTIQTVAGTGFTGDCDSHDHKIDSTTIPNDISGVPMQKWRNVVIDNNEGWKLVSPKKQSIKHQQNKSVHQQVAPVRVKGNQSAEKLKTIPRQRFLAAYVGRLHPETTEEELHTFLTEEGMKGVMCKKLKAKDGKTYKTAAFYVTCSHESEKLFYNDNCWPEGIELRDWIYYSK